jgi:hypothetical protein
MIKDKIISKYIILITIILRKYCTKKTLTIMFTISMIIYSAFTAYTNSLDYYLRYKTQPILKRVIAKGHYLLDNRTSTNDFIKQQQSTLIDNIFYLQELSIKDDRNFYSWHFVVQPCPGVTLRMNGTEKDEPILNQLGTLSSRNLRQMRQILLHKILQDGRHKIYNLNTKKDCQNMDVFYNNIKNPIYRNNIGYMHSDKEYFPLGSFVVFMDRKTKQYHCFTIVTLQNEGNHKDQAFLAVTYDKANYLHEIPVIFRMLISNFAINLYF